jgi:uncharacterized protein YciI
VRTWSAGRAELSDPPASFGDVTEYFLVRSAKGPAWDHGRLRREQCGWDEHATYMDALTDEGLVVLGGPVGEGDGDDALLVVDSPDENTVRARLADDPWYRDGMLRIRDVKRWNVLLDSRLRGVGE